MNDVESVWDYPRPPRVEPSPSRIGVLQGGALVADSIASFRVLETSHPPGYYIPPAEVDRSTLRSNERLTLCEFKGTARYYDGSLETVLRRPVPGSTRDRRGATPCRLCRFLSGDDG